MIFMAFLGLFRLVPLKLILIYNPLGCQSFYQPLNQSVCSSVSSSVYISVCWLFCIFVRKFYTVGFFKSFLKFLLFFFWISSKFLFKTKGNYNSIVQGIFKGNPVMIRMENNELEGRDSYKLVHMCVSRSGPLSVSISQSVYLKTLYLSILNQTFLK